MGQLVSPSVRADRLIIQDYRMNQLKTSDAFQLRVMAPLHGLKMTFFPLYIQSPPSSTALILVLETHI